MLLSGENSFGLCLSFLHRWQLHREGVEACGGVQKGSIDSLGKFKPLWRRGLKPSDNPEIVREFETRLLLVVFPALGASRY